MQDHDAHGWVAPRPYAAPRPLGPAIDGRAERKRLVDEGLLRPRGVRPEVPRADWIDRPTYRLDDAGRKEAARIAKMNPHELAWEEVMERRRQREEANGDR